MSDLRPCYENWILLWMCLFIPHVFMSSFIQEKFYMYRHLNGRHTNGYVTCVLQCLALEYCTVAHFDAIDGSCTLTDMSRWEGLKDDAEVVFISHAVVNDLSDIFMLPGFTSYYRVSLYKIVPYGKALAYCKGSLGPDAHLVWLETEDEENAIVNKLKDMGAPDRAYIIGLNDRSQEGIFMWGDPTERRIKPFAQVHNGFRQTEPNNYGGYENCVYANFLSVDLYGWNDQHCASLARFICELDM